MIISNINTIGAGRSAITRGPELMTNGKLNEVSSELMDNYDFDGSIDDWETGGSSVPYYYSFGGIVGAIFYCYPTGDSLLYQNTILTSGKSYRVNTDFSDIVGTATVELRADDDSTISSVAVGEDSVSFDASVTGALKYHVDGGISVAGYISCVELNPNISSQYYILSGWTFDNINKKFVASATLNSVFQTSIDFEVADYEVKYTVDRTSGGFRIRIGSGTYNNGITRYASGTYTEIISCTNASNSKIYLNGQVFTGSVSNISIKKVL